MTTPIRNYPKGNRLEVALRRITKGKEVKGLGYWAAVDYFKAIRRKLRRKMSRKNNPDGTVDPGLRLTLAESTALDERLAKFPGIPTNYGFTTYTPREWQAMGRYPHMSPIDFWTEYCDLWPEAAKEYFDSKGLPLPNKKPMDGPETDPLAAAQAASIASNLEAESETDDDIPEPPEPEEWEPRDMKTTVITRDNIDHFNNPFA
jgi:hypothetical protein